MALTALFLFFLYGFLFLTSALHLKNSVQDQAKVDVRDHGLVQSDKLNLVKTNIALLVRSKRTVIENGQCSVGRVWCQGMCRTIKMCEKLETGDYDYE